jgi:hypothetical protein
MQNATQNATQKTTSYSVFLSEPPYYYNYSFKEITLAGQGKFIRVTRSGATGECDAFNVLIDCLRIFPYTFEEVCESWLLNFYSKKETYYCDKKAN